MKHTEKTKEELIAELHELQIKYNHLLAKSDDNIGKHKQAEISLFESEKKFRLIAENTSDIITVFDMNFNITYVSPSAERIYGYTNEEAYQLNLSQFLTPESLQIVFKLKDTILPDLYSKTEQDEIYKPIELENYRKNGTTIWVETSFSFLRDNNKIPTGIVTISRDITEYKKASEELRKSEERFKTFSSLALEGIMIHRDGVIIEANNAFVKLLGYSGTDQIIGKHGLETVNFCPETRKKIEESLRTNSTETIDGELINLNGDIVSIETRGIPFVYQGHIARLVTIRDISKRKRAEKELRATVSLLDASLESTADGILMVNLKGQISKWNQKFVKMWNLSDEVLSKHDDAAVIGLILEQLTDPKAFVDKVQHLYNHPKKRVQTRYIFWMAASSIVIHNRKE